MSAPQITDAHRALLSKIMDCDSMTCGFENGAALRIIAEHDAAKPCPHVVCAGEGSQYCGLAESSVARLVKQRDALIAELQYFCDRVEAGTIQSKTTYARFKAAIDAAKKGRA